MAYVRFCSRSFGAYDSDVYIYEHVAGGIHCCGCSLAAGSCFTTPDPDVMAAHIAEHVAAGDDVPDPDELVAAIQRRDELHLGDDPATGQPRRCVVCGCTDAEACPGGCYWLELEPPRCSSCPA